MESKSAGGRGQAGEVLYLVQDTRPRALRALRKT